MKKRLSILLIGIMILGTMGFGSFSGERSTTAYPMVTFEDSRDFTIVGDEGSLNQQETIKGMGMKADFTKVAFTSEEKQYLTWTSSDTSVIKFNYWWIFNANTITGRDEVKLITKGDGVADVTLTYNPPNGHGVRVKSHVVVEGGTPVYSVSNVTTIVDGNDSVTDTTYVGSVPLFSLKDIYGPDFDDANVLKKEVTATHAMLFALELKNDSDGAASITDPNWDWDWVKQNVQIQYEGSYVKKIGGDVSGWPTGWRYNVNGAIFGYMPENPAWTGVSSSAVPLSAGDSVRWEFR